MPYTFSPGGRFTKNSHSDITEMSWSGVPETVTPPTFPVVSFIPVLTDVLVNGLGREEHAD